MATKEEQNEIKKESSRIIKFFKIELTITVFDKVIFHWVYPPQKN